jgi:hypothetical protein
MINRGIVGLHIGFERKALLGELLQYLTDRVFAAAVAPEMGALGGHGEGVSEPQSQGFHDPGIACRPGVDFLATL